MVKIRLDVLFTELLYGLWALEHYLRAVEEQIDFLAAQEPLRIKETLSEQGYRWGDAEVDFALHKLDQLTEHVYPRMFRCAYLLVLWAQVETGIRSIASISARARDVQRSFDDIHDRDFLSKAKKYFEKVLAVDLCADGVTWQQLRMLQTLRHAIVHGNGERKAVRSKSWDRIEVWAREDIGISVEEGYLELSRPFLARSFQIVKAFFDDLMDRTRPLAGS